MKDIILALSSDIFCKRWASNHLPLLHSPQAAAELLAPHTSRALGGRHSLAGTITSSTYPRNTRSRRAVRAEAQPSLTANP